MKKGQAESYSFFIGIIITLLIITGIIFAANSILSGQDTKKSFNALVKKLDKLEAGKDEEGTMAYYIDRWYILLGFPKNMKEFKGKPGDECYGYQIFKKGIDPFMLFREELLIPKPKDCPEEESCLCICDMPFDEGFLDEKVCEKPVICKSFDTIDLVGGKGCKVGLFIPGKKHGEDRGIATLHYKKEGTIVSIDDEEAVTF